MELLGLCPVLHNVDKVTVNVREKRQTLRRKERIGENKIRHMKISKCEREKTDI